LTEFLATANQNQRLFSSSISKFWLSYRAKISKIPGTMAERDAASNQLIDYKNSQTVSVLVCESGRACVRAGKKIKKERKRREKHCSK